MSDKNLWSKYTTKDATLADKDEVMIYDSEGKANKRSLMEKFWDYIVEKMTTAVIGKLETENKTIVGALNYLNGNKAELITREITAVDDKLAYDLNIDANKYMVISIQATNRWGWRYIPTHGVSGNEASSNWAVSFTNAPSGTYTFLIAIIKR